MAEEFAIETLPATNIGGTFMDFNFDLKGLDFGGIDLDGALVYFEYGEQEDLSDAKRIPDYLEKGDFDPGEGTISLEGEGLLEQGKIYYFRAMADSVHRNDLDSLKNVVDNAGFWKGVRENNKLEDLYTTTMSEAIEEKEPESIKKALYAGEELVNTFWNDDALCELFWKQGSPEPPHTFESHITHELRLVDGSNGEGKALEFRWPDPDFFEEYEIYWEIDLYFTHVDTLSFTWSQNSSHMDMYLKVDGDTLFINESSGNVVEETVDVSEYEGIKTLRFEVILESDPNLEEQTTQFENLYFE